MAKTQETAPATEPQPAPAPASRPDAVKIPHAYGKAGVPRNAQGGLATAAETLLGVDRAKGERARCRQQNGYIFATREPGQTMTFPEGHERKGEPRYEWSDRDGVQVGTLVPEARG